MDRMKVIGENLKAARGSRSREEIAERAGVSISAIQMYEDGRRIPRDVVKVRLADVLGYSVAELFYPEIFLPQNNTKRVV